VPQAVIMKPFVRIQAAKYYDCDLTQRWNLGDHQTLLPKQQLRLKLEVPLSLFFCSNHHLNEFAKKKEKRRKMSDFKDEPYN